MSVYTRTGDTGTTSLLTGERVEKCSVRVEAYGNIDEVCSVLGMARAADVPQRVKETALAIQKFLGLVMAEIASSRVEQPYVLPEHITSIEMVIDSYSGELQPLTCFIIPGDSPGGAFLDLARTVVRRAERQLWRLQTEEPINASILLYMNRLSDLCFVMARYVNEVYATKKE